MSPLQKGNFYREGRKARKALHWFPCALCHLRGANVLFAVDPLIIFKKLLRPAWLLQAKGYLRAGAATRPTNGASPAFLAPKVKYTQVAVYFCLLTKCGILKLDS